MFSSLCRARLWPKTKLRGKSSGTLCAAEDHQKDGNGTQVEKSVLPKNSATRVVQKASGQTAPSQSEARKAGRTVKESVSLEDHGHFELYLKWLLQISETKNILPTGSCPTTANPTYKSNTYVEQRIISLRADQVRKNGNDMLYQPVSKVRPYDVQYTDKQQDQISSTDTVFKLNLYLAKLRRYLAGRRSLLRQNNHSQVRTVLLTKSRNRIQKRCFKLSMRRIKKLQHQNVVRGLSCACKRKQVKGFLKLRQINTCTSGKKKVLNKFTENVLKTTNSSLATRIDRLDTSTSTTNEPQFSESEMDLQNATKETPANIAMVVMRCSRFLSHLRDEPPFMESSLPMGTLVTALCCEHEWLYVRTAHGHEGYVYCNCCLPLGTLPKGRTLRKKYNFNYFDLTEYVSCMSNELPHKTEQILKPAVNENLSSLRSEFSSMLIKKKVRIPSGKL